MSVFPLARPAWAQQFSRDPLGLLAALAVPVAVVALVAWTGNADRTAALAVLGFTFVGLIAPAVRGRSAEPGLELRWRAQPFAAGDRWGGAMATQVPVAVGLSLLMATAAMIGKVPTGVTLPMLLGVGALMGAVAATWGVALAALSRRPWHRAGLLGLALVISVGSLLPAPPLLLANYTPTGQSLAALSLLPKGLGAASLSLLTTALAGLVGVIVGVLAYGRR